MVRLFVIPGHGAGDPGATGYGYTEAERVRALAIKMKEIGGDAVQLADFSRNYYADGGINSMSLASDQAIIELHMDSASASAKGGHVIIKDGFEPDSYDNALASFISSYFPGRSVIISKRSDLANPNRAASRGFNYRLLECCFISNADDLNKFNANLDAVARGILNAFGIAATPTTQNMSAAGLNAIANQAYTGSEIKPAVRSNAGATFDVAYKNNVEIGWAQAVCTGKGNWTGTATVDFKILPSALVGYQDIDPSAWHVSSIENVVKRKIMNGYTAQTFGPNDALTRAQAVAVIYRAAGMVDDGLPYADVEQAPWYYEATKWATEQGVLNGDNGNMRPHDACTREEFATMLYRWQGAPEVPTMPSGFADWGDVSEYAREPIAWAVDQGIMNGSNGLLRPKASTTRAEAAAMITRV